MEYNINHISYKYSKDGPLVLDDVSFSIQKGKVTAIVGPSGCGKTTLVEIFSQVIPKLISTGELSGSFDVPEDTFVSVVSQNPENQLFGYGVEDAIAFGMENLGISQQEISERMEYVLDLLNLQYLRKRSVANLSGGQRQSVCIASVLAMDPDVLIMDEPTRGIDVGAKHEIYEIMNDLAAQGKAIIMISSEMAELIGMSDRIYVMCNGKMRGELNNREDMTQEKIMSYATQF